MLGRLPWLALERRSRDLRFFVFFDIGGRVYGRARRSLRPSRRHGGQLGRADSMAATSDGVVRRDHRAEAGDRAVRGEQELLEVPADVAAVALGVGDLRELVVDRVARRRR